ncbi:lipid kinase YegS [Pseudoxanthomonas spadix]|uniref:lipid kinase YegS n=1 Tax=Pseudoxanthomonas spadix TaxID=415229 RepID=UPI000EFE91AD|nr:lipid kinase YegS [Pseudoxanthomonas spadix]MBP3974351.1 lipid kinase YegS [Pseudoxanthomonas spadix]RMW97456.1 lipid kinase YegS [Pseudoxanthomonas spadix]
MSQPHWRLILNGKSAGNEAVREAVAAMRRQGVQLDVRVTWEGGDAGRYVAEAIADGVNTVIAGGGDGTLSEVASALAGREDDADALPTLALLPLGTANDFATAAGLPLAPDAALAVARDGQPRRIDLLKVTAAHGRHWCANLTTGGFGTQVTVETDEAMKRVLGGLAYLVTGLARLGRVEPQHARFSGPDFGWEGAFIALGLGNGRQAGGGQALCPDALIDDGLLDLTIIPELTGTVAATLGALITGGKRAALEQVAVRRRLPWVEIQADVPITLNLDGEPTTARQFRIDCVPGRLRMHLPPGCPLLR